MTELREKPGIGDELQRIVDDPLELETRDDASELVPRLAPQSFLRVARQLLAK